MQQVAFCLELHEMMHNKKRPNACRSFSLLIVKPQKTQRERQKVRERQEGTKHHHKWQDKKWLIVILHDMKCRRDGERETNVYIRSLEE